MYEQFYYLTGLLLSIGGLAMVDRRFKLAAFYDTKRTFVVIGIAVLFFITWDSAAIWQSIFLYGNSPYSLGIMMAPEFPIEEIFFLILLTYNGLIFYRILDHVQLSHR